MVVFLDLNQALETMNLPRDWMNRKDDPAVPEDDWLKDLWMAACFIGLPLLFLGCIGYLVYTLLKFAGKF